MINGLSTKIVKEIKIDIDKCTGCRSCELACSAFHAVPKYSSINPARSRIRITIDEVRDIYVPVFAGEYTRAECNGRRTYTINGKEYKECNFCGASCPSREFFKEPDSGLPLKCDMCEDNPPLPQPSCVEACKFDALIYEERQEVVSTDDEGKRDEMEIGLQALINKHGPKMVKDAFARMSPGLK